MKKVELQGSWWVRAIDKYRTLPTSERSVTRWMEGAVPGTVHTDLLANEKIPDPFYRMNENDVQWIDMQQWLYRKQLDVPADFLKERRIDLVAEGLDTYAEIRINNKRVGETANMFVEYRLDVKRYLRAGKNTIEVLFDSPSIRSKKLERKHGRLQVALEPHRVYVRKPQYSFGWDWGPKLTTSGIWRPIYLEAWSGMRVRDAFVRVVSIKRYQAVIQVEVELDRKPKRGLSLHVAVMGEGTMIEMSAAVRAKTVSCSLRIPNPKLWWPNGYGEQPLYSAVLSLRDGGIELEKKTVTFAIRMVRLLQEKDREGKSFIFEINGKRIYCKGANWIPSGNFIPSIPDSTYEQLLRMAKDAHMTMIRVWGGGIYEQEIFYELCDRLGLMVWQDFMYACGEYPEQPWFLKQAKQEAEKAVRRLRNHPSVVIWCGNNECEWLFCTENPDKTPDDMYGSKIFRDILPAVCKKFDGTRPYWRSSPFGESFPNDESNGNHHQWTIWSAWKDYPEYEKIMARFVTEFGFQAPANRTTFEEVTLASDRHPQSAVMEHHNKQVQGTERLFRFQAAHYEVATDFDDFIYKGQLVQAEALKCAIEHWRRRKFKTAGSLFWQLNDCWPVSSWSVIDSALRPKAGYYYAKRFFAPVLVSLKRSDGVMECWGTNDSLEKIDGTLRMALRSFDGKEVWRKSKAIRLFKNSSTILDRVDEKLCRKYESRIHYMHVQLWREDSLLSENRYFFEEPKHLALPRAKIALKLSAGEDNKVRLELRSDTLVKNVRLELEGEDVVFDDNYFDLDSRMPKAVQFVTHRQLREIKSKMRLKWLGSGVNEAVQFRS